MKKSADMFFLPSNLWIMLNNHSNTLTSGNEYLNYQFSYNNNKRESISFKKISLFFRELIIHDESKCQI